jgi:hypothetical protein
MIARENLEDLDIDVSLSYETLEHGTIVDCCEHGN